MGDGSSVKPDRADGFDQVLDRLRKVVERLETGTLTLEESLEAFEEGVRLSRQGAEILDRAEKRVEMLVQNRDGSVGTVPFGENGGESAGGNPGSDSG